MADAKQPTRSFPSKNPPVKKGISLLVKGVSVFFATVIAPILVAAGMKFVAMIGEKPSKNVDPTPTVLTPVPDTNKPFDTPKPKAVATPETVQCKVVMETEESPLRVTIKQQGKVIVQQTRNREFSLNPGEYEIDLLGSKPGLKPAIDRISILNAEKETKLHVWQAACAWPPSDLLAGKIKAPSLLAKPIFTDDFQNPTKKKLFPIGSNEFGEFRYVNGKYLISMKPNQKGWWYWPSPPFSDFACQVSARANSTSSWGIIIGTDTEPPSLRISVDDKRMFEIQPFQKKSKLLMKKMQQGPSFHPAIKGAGEVNKLLAVIRGRLLEVYVNDSAVCDPLALPLEITPAKLMLWVSGVVEFDSATVWSTKDLPTPEMRGAMPFSNISGTPLISIPDPESGWTPLFNAKDLGFV